MKPAICLAASSVMMVLAMSAWSESVGAAGGQSPGTLAASASQSRAVLDRYCVSCHNVSLNTVDLRLDGLDLARLGDHADTGEKIVRKLRAGMMPPPGRPRPDRPTLERLIRWMEGELDRTAVVHLPPPGLHRLNRAEYANAIRDLLGLQVDPATFLPSDDSSHGFDNMAGTLTVSPALIEAYLSAAAKISRLAMGSVTGPTQVVFDAPADTRRTTTSKGCPLARVAAWS